MARIGLHSVVALLEPLSDKGLSRGQMGTIVADLAPGVYDVEFSDLDGRAYAFVAVREDQLIQLFHEPTGQAA